MRCDVFFSICQVEVEGRRPSEREMFGNFFRQVELADRLGFGTAWIAESHLSSEVQKRHAAPVIPHFQGEIGLNVDVLQLSTAIHQRTDRIATGSGIMNILCNGGPIAAAERIRAFLLLQSLGRAPDRRLEVGFAAGRFPYINAPHGIVPRDGVDAAAWDVVRGRLFTEAAEVFVRLVHGATLSSDDVEAGRDGLRRTDFRTPGQWESVCRAAGVASDTDRLPRRPWWNFDLLKIVPAEAPLQNLALTIGTHDPAAQIHVNRFAPVGVFNLSITSPDVIEATHRRLQTAYHPSGGGWSRARMPRTAMVFINTDTACSPAERCRRARDQAERTLAAYWTAMEGTIDPAKVAQAADNALVGDPDSITRQLQERFHPEDRLMLWFDFFDHDTARVESAMTAFAREVGVHVDPELRS